MSGTRRIALFLTAVAALPLLILGDAMAGGGFFPLFPPDVGLTDLKTSGKVTAVIALDPNGPVSSGAPATPTGTFGSIAITLKGVGTAAATFQVQPGSSLGELRFGCNLLLTDSRFVVFSLDPRIVGQPFGGPSLFANWLSTDVTTKLFGQLGVTLVDPDTFTVLRVPAIVEVISQKCVPFPKAHQTLNYLALDELLDHQHIKPLPPTYPDLTIPGVTDRTQQWFPGFLVLEVKIGFWAAAATTTP